MIRYALDAMRGDEVAHHVSEGTCPTCGCKPEEPGDTEHAADCPAGPVAAALEDYDRGRPAAALIAALRRHLAAEARRLQGGR
jgi:hypothetical protein